MAMRQSTEPGRRGVMKIRSPFVRIQADRDQQIDRLAVHIVENIPGEPSRSEGVVDTAIRLLNEQRDAIHHLTEAIRFTVEYVGLDLLPPLPGWSWYDALVEHAPDVAHRFLEERESSRHARAPTFGEHTADALALVTDPAAEPKLTLMDDGSWTS